MQKYNLLHEPWIPVLTDGHVRLIGIAKALLDAPAIQRIETPSPLEEVALHRLLLAVLHRALPPICDVDDALHLLRQGRFDRAALHNYFNRYSDRFFLFHDSAPFLQVSDLPEEDPTPWTRLLPELATGNNPTLFDHATNEDFPKASYAEVARALLVHQSFAPGGLLRRYGVTSAKDAPLARAAAFLLVSSTLFETLVLNMVPYSHDGDFAIWETDPLTTQMVSGHATRWPLSGMCRLYTWPSRGVRLLDEGTGVYWIAYGPGVDPIDTAFRDPMVAYRQGQDGQRLPLRMSTERSFWRDFAAIFPGAGGSWPATLNHGVKVADEAGATYRFWVVLRVAGQVPDQSKSAKILDVRREVYPLPAEFLSPEAQISLQNALTLAEALGKKLQKMAWQVARGILGDKDPGELKIFSRSLPLLRIYWAQLDSAFPRFLQALGRDRALELWRDELRQAARFGWNETRRSVGLRARHLRALAEGERAFVETLTILREGVRA